MLHHWVFLFGNYKSMNDATTNILMGKLNTLNLRKNFFHGKLSDYVDAGVGVSNQLRGSSKIDAPPFIRPYHKTQEPDGKKPVGLLSH
jgi:hypothetical protein